MKKNRTTILMVGAGGYGYYYLKNLFEKYTDSEIKVTGVVDPFPENSGIIPELEKRNIRIFPTIEEFYMRDGKADLVIISSPGHFHVEQSVVALNNGSNVLCDKPLSTVVQDIETLLKARNQSGKWIMVGYQWSYSRAIQELKRDIMRGMFGKPIRMKSLCFWPREKKYYERNNWAGKIKNKHEQWILDSPLGNAMAHFIHNMFYLLGTEIEKSDDPVNLVGEGYRAYPIQNYDTGIFRVYTARNVDLLFYGSHVTKNEKGPMFNLEFERGIIEYGDDSNQIIARNGNNRILKNYGSPEDDDQFLKLDEAIKKVRKPGPIWCGPEASTAQVICMNGVQESIGEIVSFPEERIVTDEKGTRLWVDGLDEELYTCYGNNKLPSEANIPWAVCGKKINLKSYLFFPGGVQ